MDKLRANPFVTRMNVNFADKVKFVAGVIVLMPIRLILVLLLIVLSSLVGFAFVIVTYVTGFKDVTYAQSPFKNWCLSTTTSIFEAAMFIAGLRIKVVDKRSDEERQRKTGIMIAAPHSSHFDFGSMLAIGPKTPVAKQEDRWNPFFGSQLILCNGILVKRNDEASRHDVIREIKERSQVEEVGIFSEATVTNGSSLIQFKPGGFIPGLPISPLLVQYSYSGSINTVTWTWRSLDLFSLWILTCSSWTPTRATLTFLPVYYPNEEEKTNPIAFAENVRQLMSRELGIPCSRYSFEEAFFMDWATRAKISLSPAALKFVKLAHKITKQQSDNHVATTVVDGATANGTQAKANISSSEKKVSGEAKDRAASEAVGLSDQRVSSNGLSQRKGAIKGTSDVAEEETKSSHRQLTNGSTSRNGSAKSHSQASSSEQEKPIAKWTHQQVFKYMVSESLTRLQAEPIEGHHLSPLRKQVRTKDELAAILAFPFKPNSLKLKAALVDLFGSLQLAAGYELTVGHVLVLLHLVDTRVSDVWQRIDSAVEACKKSGLSEKASLQTFLWYFVGLEPFQLEEDLEEKFKLSPQFLRDNLVSTFRTAIQDNCSHLLLSK